MPSSHFWALLKNLTWVIFVFGALLVVVGTSKDFTVAGLSLAARSELSAWACLAIGTLLLAAGIALHVRTLFPDPKPGVAMAPKSPGPYLVPSAFPLDIKGPAEPVVVADDHAQFTVTGTRKGVEWPEHKVMLMHVGDGKAWPRFGPIALQSPAKGRFAWQALVNGPRLERVKPSDTWQLAFFYVGPRAQRLVDHHRDLCVYFAKDGEKNWPPIDLPLDDLVQCSPVLSVSFRVARDAQAAGR
jgi:hypothetical protein